jgi:hypothetical protein
MSSAPSAVHHEQISGSNHDDVELENVQNAQNQQDAMMQQAQDEQGQQPQGAVQQ